MSESTWQSVFQQVYVHAINGGKSVPDARSHAEHAADEARDALRQYERGKARIGFAPPPPDRPAPQNLRVTEGTQRVRGGYE